jgi:hypothetical protein
VKRRSVGTLPLVERVSPIFAPLLSSVRRALPK